MGSPVHGFQERTVLLFQFDVDPRAQECGCPRQFAREHRLTVFDRLAGAHGRSKPADEEGRH